MYCSPIRSFLGTFNGEIYLDFVLAESPLNVTIMMQPCGIIQKPS